MFLVTLTGNGETHAVPVIHATYRDALVALRRYQKTYHGQDYTLAIWQG